MAMNKQVKLYSIGLGMAKTDEEVKLYNERYNTDYRMFMTKKEWTRVILEETGKETWDEECKVIFKEKESTPINVEIETIIDKRRVKVIEECIYKELKERLSELNGEIKELIKKNTDRSIDSDRFRDNHIIAFFDNDLIRTLGIPTETLTTDFLVIEVGNTDMIITEQVIKNGLTIIEHEVTEDGEYLDIPHKYKFFTAGAGQTRQKKFMMIKEETWNNKEKALMCGLTIDMINEMGGMNANKFNAYLSLNNSASEIVKDFDIDKCVVVDDFTEIIHDEVDYISRDDKVADGEVEYITKSGEKKTRPRYKTDWGITRQFMDIPIDFMDGAGICLPRVFKKNTQIRLPWFKGLLCPINYRLYIEENPNVCSTKITDLWGKEYDIIEDDIRIIFTKSQFKLWKYYKNIEDKDGNIFMTGWEVYKACFKYYGRTLNKCMEDESRLKNMNINYQMLQTLTEMTDEQIEILTQDTKELIDRVHVDRKAQLDFLGAVKENKRRDNMQECLRLYPEMLTSDYMKKQLKDSITSYKKEAKSGRIRLDAKRTFIVPDLIHFMSLLFGDGTDYALDKNEVYFNEYKDCDRLALLRSPHLSREWALRKNVKKNDKTKYFTTKGIYVSAKDLMSLVLMCDWDGDEALVVKDSDKQKWMLDLATRQMEDLRPLYYEMGGGDAKEINNNNTFKSLKFVYEKSNIGKVSNTLTNIWSCDDYEANTDNIKMLCAYNNWIIDSAKKLELPKLPSEIKQLMNNKNYPHFFQFAKGKKKEECRPMGNGVMDRICKSVDNVNYKRFNYSKGFGKFDINKLLHDDYNNIYIKEEIISKYEELELNTRNIIKQYGTMYAEADGGFNYKLLAYKEAKKEMKAFAESNNMEYLEIVDMLVKYSFEEKPLGLAFMFNVFGEDIINNINDNIGTKSVDNRWALCDCCGTRFHKKSANSNQVYCKECAEKVNREKTKLNMKKSRM